MLFLFSPARLAAFVPADVTGEMTSVGTLFAFMLVCAGVWIMRVTNPELERAFRIPAAPLRRDPRNHYLRCDDLRPRLDQLDAIDRLAANRLHLLLQLGQEPQPHRRAASNGHAGGNKNDA